MSLAAVVLTAIALLVGFALGWTTRAARGGAELAAARAEAAALRSSHEMAAGALAAASEDAARRQSAAIGSAVGHLVDPLRSTLNQLGEELRRVEHGRINAYAGLTEQVRGHAPDLAPAAGPDPRADQRPAHPACPGPLG